MKLEKKKLENIILQPENVENKKTSGKYSHNVDLPRKKNRKRTRRV